MRPIVAWSVCLTVTVVSRAETAEPIEPPFGLRTRVGPRTQCIRYGGAHQRNLANTTEPSMCGGDAAYCQIPLALCNRLAKLEHFAGELLSW